MITSILIDTSIVKTSVYTGGLSCLTGDIMIFTIISLIYAIGQDVILKLIVIRGRFKTHTMFIFHKSVEIIQYILITILLITIVQMITTSVRVQ